MLLYIFGNCTSIAVSMSLLHVCLMLLNLVCRIALLHTACMHNNVEEIEALLDEGVKADIALKGLTPLFTACQVLFTYLAVQLPWYTSL